MSNLPVRAGICLTTMLIVASLLAGCGSDGTDRRTPDSGSQHVAPTGPGAAELVASDDSTEPATNSPPSGPIHDPAHAPIDCPLRKQGVDPSHLRPFDDLESYIAFLDRPDRDTWQKPDAVIEALDLGGDETVVDLGAGSGYFSFRLAAALPEGRIIAAETEAEMVRHIHHKASTNGVQNIEARLIQPGEPAVPDTADLVFVCDVLHHVEGRAAWLEAISSGMRSGARLVLIEFKEGDLPEGPPESVKIPRDQIVDLVTNAGLNLVSEKGDLLPYQTFQVFRKP